jgi:hypothetical protein
MPQSESNKKVNRLDRFIYDENDLSEIFVDSVINKIKNESISQILRKKSSVSKKKMNKS